MSNRRHDVGVGQVESIGQPPLGVLRMLPEFAGIDLVPDRVNTLPIVFVGHADGMAEELLSIQAGR